MKTCRTNQCTADRHARVCHIGDLFIAVENHTGQGLGRILMEEAIDWASQSGVIHKLALSQTEMNEAVHLYQV